ncbi:expansin-B15-like [Silene latifolia]|uniref:expansin-B15-like n=1 Tax=Silene latifolia TaxID=37657 RepID=UPI003D76C5D0
MYDQSYGSGWSPAGATWYGPANGAGSDGGACGFRDTVNKYPYSSMISAGGPSIYQKGQGCGVCYEVKCTENEACSGNSVTVTITDECPGCSNSNSETAHFDLSGTAFGALAKSGLADQLRNAGVLQLQYKMVECDYPGVTVQVRVDPGSNPYYLAVAIEYAEGTGISKVELQAQSSNNGWMNMYESLGVTWAINTGVVIQPPFSIRL